MKPEDWAALPESERVARLGTATLDCGCRPGFYLCPEAVTLWAEVGAAYQRACRGGDWRECERLRREYGKHAGEREVQRAKQ